MGKSYETPSYKGYKGKYEVFCSDDGKYYAGVIEGISDLVTFCAVTEDSIYSNFCCAVDDYIDFCKSVGKM